MARPSKIDRLPPEIRDAIGDLRRNGRTIDEILAHLRRLGVVENDVSRSGLGRHLQRWDAVAKRLTESRAAAEAIMARIEDQGADDRMARFNVQALHASIMELMGAEDGSPIQLDPKEAMQVSAALKNLATAAKTDQTRYAEMKELLEAERKRSEQVKQIANDALASGDVSISKQDRALAALHAIRQAYGVV